MASLPSTGSDSPMVGEIEVFLREVTSQLVPEPPTPSGPGRPRVLPALALWAGLLVCVLRGFSTQLALWRLLTHHGLWYFPRCFLTDQAVYARLARAGTTPLETFFTQVSAALTDRLQPVQNDRLASFATEVAAIDVSTLDQVQRKLPHLRGIPKGDPVLLPGKLETVFDVRRQLWRTVRISPDAARNEKVDARQLAATLPPGSLVLADLGYFGFAWFDWLTDADYFWVSRLREKTSYALIHCYYARGDTFDGLVWLGAHRAARSAHAVRLITFSAHGRLHRYITNVLDPQQLSPQQVAELYARRWDIEMAFQLIKQHLGLHLLWSAKPVIIHQQVLAVLIISQVLQALRLEIAWRAGVDPFEVSLPLLVQYAPYFASQGQDPVRVFVEDGRRLGFIRPSRRTHIQVPDMPADYAPLPSSVPLTRTPRYAGRRC
jgi:hypothetical protein